MPSLETHPLHPFLPSNAKVLMLDEPTGSLDNRSTNEVMALLCKLNREQGITILQVTHSEEAAAYGSRIIRLSDGEVVTK